MLSDRQKYIRKKTKRERNQKLVDMYVRANGKLSFADVAKEFGISASRVQIILNRAGVDAGGIKKAYYRRNRVEKVCPVCKEKFTVVASNTDKTYCDWECFSKKRGYTEEELWEELRRIYKKHGKITTSLIQKEAKASFLTFLKYIGRMDKIRKVLEEEHQP